ncbi:hypothetical protein CVT25_006326 [Psilocybe cyanescens]|uniref:Uncharacterized protein n=1 Tax=Psilocybe cyanescens TaxID=93625 RepID=A0A409X3W0_PSICY|nr:hypothetical protein CVT25_006326 [Psilocybe cyanescens]
MIEWRWLLITLITTYHAPQPNCTKLTPAHLPAIFIHMSAGASPPARKAFSTLFTEPLFGPEAAAVHPLKLEVNVLARKVASASASSPSSPPPSPAPAAPKS